ncbi:MAG: RidA family protein [Deltaproteobacteria bacterium]|nr:RidA family protein [Deltaproteobacteria bacterium]
MPLHVIKTDKAPAAIGPYSQAILSGPWLFVSGQIPLAPGETQLVDVDFSAQARQALKNLKEIVEAAGYDLGDVVSVDVFLTDMTRFSLFNEIYGQFFGDHKPARAVVEVKALPREAQVEVKCIACRGA